MRSKPLILLLRYAAIVGNIIYILWILYNGIKEGFKGTWPEKISYILLMALLAVNSFLIVKRTNEIVQQS